MKRTLSICLFLLLVPLTAQAQKTLQDAATATGAGLDLPISVGAQQTNGVTAQVSGTFSGTITWRATVDGTNFVDVIGTNLTTGVQATTATAPGLYSFLLPRISAFRGPITTYSSGSITVVAAAAVGVARLYTEGGTPGGSNTQVQFNSSGAFAGDSDLTFLTDTLTVTKLVIGAGSAITSSGAGGALGSNAFTSTAYTPTSRTITATSPVTIDGTTSADLSANRTIACATCVIASSPGAGIAHFAGSTQTVTSSSIVNADITNGTIDLTAKVTGLLPAANIGVNVLDQSVYYAADAGSNDTYVITLSPVPAGYVTGGHYRFKANTANTGAATININSLGAKTIKKAAGGITTDLADNDILSGQFVDVVYDGTNMQMQSLLGNAASGGGITNSAGANVIPKSDGSNLVASRISDDGLRLILQAAGAGATVEIGDILSNTNSTYLLISDDLRSITFEAGAAGVSVNGFTSVVRFGDAEGNGSSTFIAVNDADQSITLTAANGLVFDKTITAGGTTGAQAINKTTGSVNFAAAATSLVVTNSIVSSSSIIQCTVATNDATMKSAQCVAGAGSFTIYSNAAATAETRVNFTVTN